MKSLSSLLPKGWYLSDAEDAKRLHDELQRELPCGHILHKKEVEVVAHREGTDDILCRHKSDPDHFTVIHLSWIWREEVDSKHPSVEDDGDFESFIRYEGSFPKR